MARRAGVILLVAVMLAFGGCPRGDRDTPSAGGVPATGDVKTNETGLVIYCGAGLRPPVTELLATFEREKGIRVETVFSGSGILLSQMALSQKGDIYIPGDHFYMQQAVDKGFITKQADAAVFIPVIAVAKGNPKGVKGLKDLARDDLRVGLGEAKACAVGRSSAVMLAKAGIEKEVKPAYTSSTVNELGNQMKLGTLDAAIIWDAIAKFYPDEVDMVPVEAEYREILTIPVGVLKFSENAALAEAFMEFASSDRAKEVFKKHGYTVEKPKDQ